MRGSPCWRRTRTARCGGGARGDRHGASQPAAAAQVYLENALKAAEMTLRDKIISQENDMVGIVFMGAVRGEARERGPWCDPPTARP